MLQNAMFENKTCFNSVTSVPSSKSRGKGRCYNQVPCTFSEPCAKPACFLFCKGNDATEKFTNITLFANTCQLVAAELNSDV
jgi:hypothetical protein